MGSERSAGAQGVRRGMRVAGALLSATALVGGGGQAIALAVAAPRQPAAGAAREVAGPPAGCSHRPAV